jgi:hypothetical protein
MYRYVLTSFDDKRPLHVDTVLELRRLVSQTCLDYRRNTILLRTIHHVVITQEQLRSAMHAHLKRSDSAVVSTSRNTLTPAADRECANSCTPWQTAARNLGLDLLPFSHDRFASGKYETSSAHI